MPAASMRLRAIDAVHTRMGASDNLAQVGDCCLIAIVLWQVERSILTSDAAKSAIFQTLSARPHKERDR